MEHLGILLGKLLNDPTLFDDARSRHYNARHRRSLLARFITWREQECVCRALHDAGSPKTALDLPCGTGRFWPAFARGGIVTLTGADRSRSMLDVAEHNRLSGSLPDALLQCSAFDIDLEDDSVEIAACLRFFHHLALSSDRRRLLAELARVSSTGLVLLSTMVSGNIVGNRKIGKPKGPPTAGYGRRFVRTPKDVEAEFAQNGFTIVHSYDSFPGIDCWRFYLLRRSKAEPLTTLN